MSHALVSRFLSPVPPGKSVFSLILNPEPQEALGGCLPLPAAPHPAREPSHTLFQFLKGEHCPPPTRSRCPATQPPFLWFFPLASNTVLVEASPPGRVLPECSTRHLSLMPDRLHGNVLFAFPSSFCNS